ncbi:hypothetical protein GJ744_001529 [Endocarpon pusillum]|uniref:Uncharacterized protein n=1 Tax=Endocarpon pusillum TaxID=364733 RepID=A0A8H7A9I5_9EURO|nr:hypothetical protein GJ744_001529 [Endocarpon pusillum]
MMPLNGYSLSSLPSLLICAFLIYTTAWTDENHPNACQHGPWSGRLQGPEKTQPFLAHENISTIAIPAELANLPIDHTQPSEGTYQNRYWVNDQFYQPGGPIFVHDVGENNAERSAHRYLNASSSYLLEILQEFHGIGIVWEHRYLEPILITEIYPSLTHFEFLSSYFGESLPFAVNLTTPWEHLKPLTYKQALADIPYFARTFHRKSFSDHDLTPNSTPWVMIGCSYSGLRAALSRQMYPKTFYAAYASSAPVGAVVNFSSYFDQVYRGMVDYGYGNCSRDLHEIISYIDIQLSSGDDTAAAIKELFLGPGLGAQNSSNGDFALALAFIYTSFQSQGMAKHDSKGAGAISLPTLCDYLQTEPQAQMPAPTEGPAPVRAPKYLTERLASWPPLLKSINRDFKTNCRFLNDSLPQSCDLSQTRESDPMMIAWSWLLCSEWGFFSVHNAGPRSLVSRYLSQEYHQSLCDRQFPGAEATGELPRVPRAEQFVHETGGQRMRPSNTFWTAGEYDPWRGLTPLSLLNLATNPAMATTEIPECNVQMGEKKIFGHVIPYSQHCADFTAGFEPGKQARSYFVQALKWWLKCYKPSNNNRV